MQSSIYQRTIETLADAGIETPRLEARILIADVLGKSVDEIPAAPAMSEYLQEVLQKKVEKRLSGMPIDKIIGHREFYKYDFKVTQDVLSPRPDTETLVEAAVKLIKENNFASVLDLGTGSGCILLSILKDLPSVKGTGVDISDKALDVATQNAAALRVKNRSKLVQKNWFDDDFVKQFKNKFDVIVSNPPYIKTEDIEKLDVDVKKYDPKIALDGGADGLKDYRRIAELAPDLLRNKGYILLEVGHNQATDVKNIFKKQAFKYANTIKDLAGIDRVIIFQKKP